MKILQDFLLGESFFISVKMYIKYLAAIFYPDISFAHKAVTDNRKTEQTDKQIKQVRDPRLFAFLYYKT